MDSNFYDCKMVQLLSNVNVIVYGLAALKFYINCCVCVIDYCAFASYYSPIYAVRSA